ncbi:hypothetical protein D1007_13275 [Hordeum vulgare]|nr:hypothetical protein D1007_13275 [Hordeum vulgare]
MDVRPAPLLVPVLLLLRPRHGSAAKKIIGKRLGQMGEEGGANEERGQPGRRCWPEGKEARSVGRSGECFPPPELARTGGHGRWRRRGRGVRGGEEVAFGGVG